MKPIGQFEPIIGDDLGFKTCRYFDVPEEYGFKAIQKHNDCPLTNERWDALIKFAEAWYYQYEIVGRTFTDFLRILQNSYDIGADTLERVLEVYNDDIAKPILGRTEKTTYDLVNAGSESIKEDETASGSTESTKDNTGTIDTTSSAESTRTDNLTQSVVGENARIDTPINSDSPNTQVPSEVDKSTNTTNNTGTQKTDSSGTGKETQNLKETLNQEDTNTRNLTRSGDTEHSQTGTVITELSDLGVRPNYESLNGYIDNNRTYLKVFTDLFKDCFSFNDVITW